MVLLILTVNLVQLDTLTGTPTSPPRNSTAILGHHESPTSQNLLLSPSSLRTPVVSPPPSGTPVDQIIPDKEREKTLYPGRVLLTSKFAAIMVPFYPLVVCARERQFKNVCSGMPRILSRNGRHINSSPSYVQKHDTEKRRINTDKVTNPMMYSISGPTRH